MKKRPGLAHFLIKNLNSYLCQTYCVHFASIIGSPIFAVAENTHHRGKYHCTTGLFDWFGFD